MTRLTDTQAMILSAAANRNDRLALPLPSNLKGGAAAKVVGALLTKGFLEEVEAAAGDPVWRETGDGHATTLIVTDAGLAAIKVEPEELSETQAPQRETSADIAGSNAGATTNEPDALGKGTGSRTIREGTKQAMLIAMLRATEGATIAEIVVATRWQPHTVRGAMAGALKKRLGLEVISEKVEGRGRVYHLPVA